MQVEVDLYSGRPNPTFVLSAQAAQELWRRIGRLPPASGPPSSHDGLGYRGLHVHPGTNGRPGTPNEVLVAHGAVVVSQDDGTQCRLADEDRALERWLIEIGAVSLGSDVVAVVRGDQGG